MTIHLGRTDVPILTAPSIFSAFGQKVLPYSQSGISQCPAPE
jgi:hypothetical protein